MGGWCISFLLTDMETEVGPCRDVPVVPSSLPWIFVLHALSAGGCCCNSTSFLCFADIEFARVTLCLLTLCRVNLLCLARPAVVSALLQGFQYHSDFCLPSNLKSQYFWAQRADDHSTGSWHELHHSSPLPLDIHRWIFPCFFPLALSGLSTSSSLGSSW